MTKSEKDSIRIQRIWADLSLDICVELLRESVESQKNEMTSKRYAEALAYQTRARATQPLWRFHHSFRKFFTEKYQ